MPSTCSFIIKEQIRGRCPPLHRQLISPDRALKRHERRANKHFIKCKIFIVLEPLPDGILAVKKAVVASVTPLTGGASPLHEEIRGQFSKWNWTDLKSLYPLWLACRQKYCSIDMLPTPAGLDLELELQSLTYHCYLSSFRRCANCCLLLSLSHIDYMAYKSELFY